MTLYYNLLEKRMKDQPLPHGIPMFWNSPKSVEPDYYSTAAKLETTANLLSKPEAAYPQPRLQETTINSPGTEKTTYSKPREIRAPKEDSHYKGPQPGGVKVTTQAIIDCANNSIAINALASGVVAKIPVLLSELTIQLNVNSIVELPEKAHEIKQIKRQLKVTQCVLLQNTNVLFIKGFVRKNIEYTTGNHRYANGTYGDIHHCIVEVPFNCTTAVTFNGIEPAPLDSNKSSELQFLTRSEVLMPGLSDKDELLSNDMSELNQISTAFYNELPFCELTSSKIVDFYSILPFEDRYFNSIEEKMVIYLSLKILQYRKVAIHTLK